MAPQNPCHLPPGREDEVINCLPDIPRPQWDHFVAKGRFPNGIEKGLEETAACPWVPSMLQQRTGNAIVAGSVVSYTRPGLLPPGWYKHRQASAPPPPPPEETTRSYAERAHGDLLGGNTLAMDGAGGGFLLPVADPLESSGPTVATCNVTPVPTIDLFLPFPWNAGTELWPDGRSQPVLTGDLGRMVLRIPGSDHPMFSTGLGIAYIAREYLSPLGRMLYQAWDTARAGTLASSYFGRYRDMAWIRPIFSLRDWPSSNAMLLATRYYQASHMQCLPRNFTPKDAAWDPSARGVAIPARWRVGGAAPAAFSGAGFDSYEEAKPIGTAGGLVLSGSFGPGPLNLHQSLDVDGREHASKAPEAPFGFRDTWAGRTRTIGNFNGPFPGAFKVAT